MSGWQESDGETPWQPEESDEDNEWRGDEHLDDWPEQLAGPEYWLYKRDRDAQD